MYVRIGEPSLVQELISFLDRCNCNAVKVGHDVIEIDVDHEGETQAALRLVRAGRCYSCGGEIERTLAELGSVKCQDCRDANGHAAERRRWGTVQLDGYLRVWAALYPNAELTRLDASSNGRASATTAS